MRKLLIAVFTLFWCALVFLVTFWVTFPSDTLVERVRWEVPERLGNEYSIDLASVSPWWVGLSAQDVKVYHTPRSWRSDEPAETSLVGMMNDVRLRVSPLSLLRRNPYVSGSLTLVEGTIDYAIGVSAGGKGDVSLSELSISADELPLADLMVLLPEGMEMSATGNVEIDVELEGGDDGMADGNGHIEIGGANITLSELVHPEMGALGFDIPISELVLVAEVRDGKATVQRGLVDSELLKVDIRGDITLREPIDRSQVDLQFVITDVSPDVGMLEMALAPGKQDDGYHYTLRGMLGRASFRPARSSSVSRDRTPRPVPTRSPQVIDRTETDEEREKRRAEIRARLEQRRAEREGRTIEEPEPLEEEVFEDEPLFDEELPPEGEEEFFDEELPPEGEEFEEFE